MNRRSFVAGIAATPIAAALPATAPPATRPEWWIEKRAVIDAVSQAAVEGIRLAEAGAPAAVIEANDRQLDAAIRALGIVVRQARATQLTAS